MLIWERMQHLPTHKAILCIAMGGTKHCDGHQSSPSQHHVLTGVGHLFWGGANTDVCQLGGLGLDPVTYQTASMSEPWNKSPVWQMQHLLF